MSTKSESKQVNPSCNTSSQQGSPMGNAQVNDDIPLDDDFLQELNKHEQQVDNELKNVENPQEPHVDEMVPNADFLKKLQEAMKKMSPSERVQLMHSMRDLKNLNSTDGSYTSVHENKRAFLLNKLKEKKNQFKLLRTDKKVLDKMRSDYKEKKEGHTDGSSEEQVKDQSQDSNESENDKKQISKSKRRRLAKQMGRKALTELAKEKKVTPTKPVDITKEELSKDDISKEN
jgi:hypothetical protein